MKINTALFFLVPFLCLNIAQAAPVGSPASLLEKGQWDFALEGAHLSRRTMKTTSNSNYEVSISHGYHSRSFGLTERLLIKAKVGGTYGYLYDGAASGEDAKTSLSGGLGWGLQLQGIIFENKDLGVEWDGSTQFLHMRSHHKRSGKANSDWYEWQVSSSVAKAIGRFKPYGGIKFSTVNLEHDDGEGNKTSYDEDESIGPFIGTDIYLGDDRDIVINLEAGFLIGNEFSGQVKYRF